MQNDNFSQRKLPDKLYFKIREVSEITQLETYILRFWETEFTQINPNRTATGQRLYRKSDVETILKIKDLLYDKKFTIQGAKQYLKTVSVEKRSNRSSMTIDQIRMELKNIREILK
ncbi:MAG TPA: MerR family transcriptional regulator [Bacteroidetes bacterium]|nr:MerR family transcriptional regulator [Bacteroidota bacterium]